MNLKVWLWKGSGGYFPDLIAIHPFQGDELKLKWPVSLSKIVLFKCSLNGGKIPKHWIWQSGKFKFKKKLSNY